MQIPKHFKLTYSQEEIARAVKRLGLEISKWAEEVNKRSGTDILGIPVLRGGIFFFADLVRQIEHSVFIAPVRTWAYEVGQNEALRESVKVNIDDVPAQGRSVLLIDDVCDSGRTLEALTKAFRQAGAAEVRSAVLVRRLLDQPSFRPDYVGFEYKGPEWFVGYGMEDTERWRNLDSIYIISRD